MAKRGGLGKGIDSLRPSVSVAAEVLNKSEEEVLQKVIDVDIKKIKANPNQPRKFFDEATLEELANSIKQVGVLQPLVVIKKGENYLIVSGERRYRASILAGMDKIPVAVMDLTEQQVSEISIIENIQREDLSAIEEARAYQNLIYSFGYTQDEVSKKIGKNRATVANSLRLLKLSEKMQNAISDGVLTAGHARAILALKTEREKELLFKKIVENGISVREAESFNFSTVEESKSTTTIKTKKVEKDKDINLKKLEDKLMDFFGSKVVITGDQKKGHIKIDYYSMEDLERIYDILDRE